MSSSKVATRPTAPRQGRGYPRESAAVKYSVERVRNANGVEQEVLTLEDTPEPSAAAAAAAAGPSNGAPPQASSRARNDPYGGYEPAQKKRKSDVASGSGTRGYAAGYQQAPAAAVGYAPGQYAPAQQYNAYGQQVAAAPAASGTKRKHDEYERDNRDGQRGRERQVKYADSDGHFIVEVGATVSDGARHDYVIERLLGQGTFGKVVAAKRKQDSRRYAVKIIRAVHKYQEAAKTEIRVLTLLTKNDRANIKKCIPLVSHFDFHGHTCLVTPLLSCSVFDFLKDNSYEPFPLSHVQRFGRQLLTSLAYVHDNKLIHTDLKPENILLERTQVTIVPSRRNRHRKILDDTGIQLIDFGSATFEGDYHATVVSTRHYRAPEIILNMGWSYPCDMWSIGCILVEFVTGEALFQTHDNLEHLAMMEKVFGPMPTAYATLAQQKTSAAQQPHPEWFKRVPANQRSKKGDYVLAFPLSTTQKQSVKFVKGMRKLKDIIGPMNSASQQFADLCEGLLRWDQRDRLTVHEALDHDFFKETINDEGSHSR
ncbi:kinase-like domain-containing protein [Rhodotorula diobovata]|uniref:Kinase-like domain-containing protein n=1 Tax=Rhodotorula diobovata TaxID=5288 RepID=A0A5C5G7Y0_9BASI|nr:kinase-like domain-containing protein [Rhodotorula diobovata]